MAYDIPDPSGLFSRAGDAIKEAGDLDSAIQYGLMGTGLGAQARQRANQFRVDAMNKVGDIQSQAAWESGVIGAGTALLKGVGSVALGSLASNSSTTGPGTPSAPQIDTANPSYFDQQLMKTKFAHNPGQGW